MLTVILILFVFEIFVCFFVQFRITPDVNKMKIIKYVLLSRYFSKSFRRHESSPSWLILRKAAGLFKYV